MEEGGEEFRVLVIELKAIHLLYRRWVYLNAYIIPTQYISVTHFDIDS